MEEKVSNCKEDLILNVEKCLISSDIVKQSSKSLRDKTFQTYILHNMILSDETMQSSLSEETMTLSDVKYSATKHGAKKIQFRSILTC